MKLTCLALLGGCVIADPPSTSSTVQAGMRNGMLNGLQPRIGLAAWLTANCPVLAGSLMSTGNLSEPQEVGIAAELALGTPCERFMFYTVQLLVPHGETVSMYEQGMEARVFEGAMGMQSIVQQDVYPEYTFSRHAFLSQYPIIRRVVTHGYAALTNDIERDVSYKTGTAVMDAHRDPDEDQWPREFLHLFPSQLAVEYMAVDPLFLARQPNFFDPCDPRRITYSQHTTGGIIIDLTLIGGGSLATGPGGGQVFTDEEERPCPVPVVVHGDTSYTEDLIPGRSCRIQHRDEPLPENTFLSGDVIVPQEAGTEPDAEIPCPMIWYTGREPGETIFDDRRQNPVTTTEGCDVRGPSVLETCDFDVVDGEEEVPDEFFVHPVFNVQPIEP